VEVIAIEQWRKWIEEGRFTLLPYIHKFKQEEGRALPAFWDGAWKDASPYACLLESGKGGKYTIVGLRPVSFIEGKGETARILEPIGGEWVERNRATGAPLALLRDWLAPWKAPRTAGIPDCIGGALGFCGYDVVRSLEKLPVFARDDLELPDYAFGRYEELWIADHEERTVICSVHTRADKMTNPDRLRQFYEEAGRRAAEMEQQWNEWQSFGETAEQQAQLSRMRERMEQDNLQIDVEKLPGLSTSMTKGEYQEAVRRIQQYIGEGDVFQVNLALRQSRPSGAAPETLYEWLRLVNPSPYMGMLRAPSFSLVSGSPELLVKLDDTRLSTRPIAGTRRRGRTPEEDRAMEDELLGSEKERAEHVMLVDLERNDLGRVAEYGTVKVPELMTVERYSHVMHLVSQVEANLAKGKDALDVLAAVFPGGTITGAPKIRTMEIIEELEPTRRGPYTGSMGWIDYSGNMEFNIIIRTIAVQNGICHIQAGAGIVIDSEPEREFYESLNKAKALWKAVQYSEGQGGQ